jgi:hypothetical protein
MPPTTANPSSSPTSAPARPAVGLTPKPPAFLSPTEQGGTAVGWGGRWRASIWRRWRCASRAALSPTRADVGVSGCVEVAVSSLWLAQACNEPGSEKTKVQSVGREPGERVYFASRETCRQTVETNQSG